MNPYIGVTGFTDFLQVRKMQRLFESYLLQGSEWVLHVGVMMSYKTLRGIPSKWQHVYPKKETVSEIFASSGVYNCLHYVDTERRPTLSKDLFDAIAFGGEEIEAIQLDMVWPDPEGVARAVCESGRQIEVILQVGRGAFDEVGNDPRALVARLAQYEDAIHRVLLDKSMGRGVALDARTLLPYLRLIRDRFPDFGLGVAGGLGPRTMRLIEPIVREIPNISVDAESHLRQSGSSLDPIDWGTARSYITNALDILDKPCSMSLATN